MLRRAFSTYWLSGQYEKLLEMAPFFIYGSKSPLMIISGPTESGKTNLTHNILAELVSSGLYNESYSISTSLNPHDELEGAIDLREKSKTQVFLESLHDQVSSLISHFEAELDKQTKQSLYELYITYIKKVTSYIEENQVEISQELIQGLNDILQNNPQVKELTSLNEKLIIEVIHKVPLNIGFQIIASILLSTDYESSLGSESSEFLVKLLVCLNEYCNVKGIPNFLLRIDDSHFLYKEDQGKDYLKNLIFNLLAFKGVSCLIIGNCQFEQIIRMLHQNKDSIAWFHLDNYPKETTDALYKIFEMDVNEENKEEMWKVVGGNFAVADEVNDRMKQGLSLNSIYNDFLNSGASSVDAFFEVLEMQNDNLSIKEKIFGANNNAARAFTHFLTNFMENHDQGMKMSIKEFSYNPVVEGLVIYGLLNYNPIDEVLKFDKPIMAELLKKSSKYSKYSGWLNKSKNKQAYESLLDEYSKSEMNP